MSASAVRTSSGYLVTLADGSYRFAVSEAQRDALMGARMARCGCGVEVASRSDLAFFERRGFGSDFAERGCGNCGYFDVAHTDEVRARNRHVCDDFTPRGDPGFDSFYDGCRGWD